MEKLTPDELRYIHERMLELNGRLSGEKNPGMIDYICEKLFIITFGHEQYPNIFQKAATLMFSLARGHYFFDGNKRTAAMATYVFLMKNGYELIVSDDNLFNTCIKVATGDFSEKHLVKWLKNNAHLITKD